MAGLRPGGGEGWPGHPIFAHEKCGCGAAGLGEDAGVRLGEDEVAEGALIAGPGAAASVNGHGRWHGPNGEGSQGCGRPVTADGLADDPAPAIAGPAPSSFDGTAWTQGRVPSWEPRSVRPPSTTIDWPVT